VAADTLNGRDYVLNREDVLEFDRRRRRTPGHPSLVDQARREQRRQVNESNVRRLRERRERLTTGEKARQTP
jgi:hypothetical protein